MSQEENPTPQEAPPPTTQPQPQQETIKVEVPTISIPYNKEDIVHEIDKNMNTLFEYFIACFNRSTKIVENNTINEYLITRIKNIQNLLTSLIQNGDLEVDFDFDGIFSTVLKELYFGIEDINYEYRTVIINEFIDDIYDLSIFRDNDDEEEINKIEEKNEEEDTQAHNGTTEEPFDDDIHKDFNELETIPDNISFVIVNNKCKKQKIE